MRKWLFLLILFPLVRPVRAAVADEPPVNPTATRLLGPDKEEWDPRDLEIHCMGGGFSLIRERICNIESKSVGASIWQVQCKAYEDMNADDPCQPLIDYFQDVKTQSQKDKKNVKLRRDAQGRLVVDVGGRMSEGPVRLGSESCELQTKKAKTLPVQMAQGVTCMGANSKREASLIPVTCKIDGLDLKTEVLCVHRPFGEKENAAQLLKNCLAGTSLDSSEFEEPPKAETKKPEAAPDQDKGGKQ